MGELGAFKKIGRAETPERPEAWFRGPLPLGGEGRYARMEPVAAVDWEGLQAGQGLWLLGTPALFAADTAVFAMPEIDVGQGGGASFLQRILPPSKVRRMMLTGERIAAAEAHRLGLAHQVLAADRFHDDTEELLLMLAMLGTAEKAGRVSSSP